MNQTPRHIAIIMDGNGRWAAARGLDRFQGHLRGAESVRVAVKAALKNSVEYLTLYTFSTENWGRPKEEVDALMELFIKYTTAETQELKKQGVKVLFIGDKSGLSDEVAQALEKTSAETAECTQLTLVMALNYSARWEIAQMVKQISQRVEQGEIAPDDIDFKMVSDNLTTAGIPDPDLVIRTSGEYRLSNFLLWQSAYSEFYFTQTLWPDFSQEEFEKAITEYKHRNRRFGLI